MLVNQGSRADLSFSTASTTTKKNFFHKIPIIWYYLHVNIEIKIKFILITGTLSLPAQSKFRDSKALVPIEEISLSALHYLQEGDGRWLGAHGHGG